MYINSTMMMSNGRSLNQYTWYTSNSYIMISYITTLPLYQRYQLNLLNQNNNEYSDENIKRHIYSLCILCLFVLQCGSFAGVSQIHVNIYLWSFGTYSLRRSAANHCDQIIYWNIWRQNNMFLVERYSSWTLGILLIGNTSTLQTVIICQMWIEMLLLPLWPIYNISHELCRRFCCVFI